MTVTFFGRPFASGNFAQIAQKTGVASDANTTTPWSNFGAGQKFEWYVTASDGTTHDDRPDMDVPNDCRADPVFVGVGDIAACTNTNDTDTGNVDQRDRRQYFHGRRQRLPGRHRCGLHELLRADAMGQLQP